MKRTEDIPASWVEVTLPEIAHHDLGKMLDLKAGDLIVCEGGEPGRCAVWDGRVPEMKYQKALHRVRVLGGIDPRIIALKLRRDAESGKLTQLFTGTTIKHLTGKALAKYRVLVPPLNEQRRIVAKIEALQHHIRRARTALDAIPPLLENLRQSVLVAALRGDLTADWRARNPDVEPAVALLERIREERRRRWEEAELAKMAAKGKVPEDDRWREKYSTPGSVGDQNPSGLPAGWCWARWEEIGFCQNGRAFPSGESLSEGVKLLRPENLHVSGQVEWTEGNTRYMPESWATAHPGHVVRENELVISLTAPALEDELLGRVCLTGSGELCLLNQRIARLTPIEIDSRFCLWLFKSPFFRRYVEGLNTGSLIQHMFTSQIDDFCFPLPPISEQSAIARAVERMLAASGRNEERVSEALAHCKKLEQAILAKAFRGDLVPQDPNDEPASKLLERIRAETSARPPTRRGRRKAKPKPAVEPSPRLPLAPPPAAEPELPVLASARDYTLDDWRRALLTSLGDDPADRQDAIEAAAIWAAENQGLVYERLPKNGLIVRGLKSALRSAIRRGEVERLGASRVRLVGPGSGTR